MASNTYTALKVLQVVGFRAGGIKDKITANAFRSPDPAMEYLLECLNSTLRAIHKIRPLPTFNDRYVFETFAPLSITVVSISTADPAVVDCTGEALLTDGAVAGMAFAMDSEGYEYRIASVDSQEQLTLDGAYVGTTGALGTAAKIAQDRYSLPANFGDIKHASIDGPKMSALNIRFPNEIARQRYDMRAKSFAVGAPVDITRYDKDSNNNWQVELDPFPDDSYRVNLRTSKSPTTLTTTDVTDGTIVPVDDEDIDVVFDGTLAYWMEGQKPGSIQNWINTSLKHYVMFDRNKTDEMFGLIPDDTTRSFRSVNPAASPDTDFAL